MIYMLTIGCSSLSLFSRAIASQLHRWQLLVFSRDLGAARARVQETMANHEEEEKEELYIRRLAKATVSAKFSSRWKRLCESQDAR